MDNTAKMGSEAESAADAVRVCRMYAGCTGAGLRIFARQRVDARACIPFPWPVARSGSRSERRGF